jgi:hypothetical protein
MRGALIAPLLWLERSRGRKRLALATLYGLIVATAGVLLWRASRLSGLPDVGDPFDARSLRMLRVPDDRNAFVLYRQAGARLKRDPVIDRRIFGGPFAYPKGDAKAIAYLAANAEALELWRRGTERPDALCVPLDELTFETRLTVIQDHRQLFRLALIEASRLRDAGDVAGAWGWYRAVLRGSRHLGNHGVIIGRLVGIAEYTVARGPIGTWMLDPRVDAKLLRRALADVREVDAMTMPASEPLQVEYLSEMHALRDPQWLIDYIIRDPWSTGLVDRMAWYHYLPAYWRVLGFLDHEPERGRRIIRLAFANWLAHCDEPPNRRPPMVGTKATPRMLYDVPGPGGLPARELAGLIESSLLCKTFLPSFEAFQRSLDRERPQRAWLVVALAERLYTLERGRLPESPDALVGTYLDRLPDGYIRPSDDDRAATKGTQP